MSHDKSSMYGKQLGLKVGRYTFNTLKNIVSILKYDEPNYKYVCVNV
jgi:hypothetical protein